MIQKLSILVIPTLFILINTIQAQENKPGEEAAPKEIFLKQMAYLMADGGVWEAENPGYKKDEQYSAKTYKYEMSKGVHSEQFLMKILSDINSVGWWTSWDSYFLWHPVKQQGVYHGLGSNGWIAEGRLYAANEEEFVNIFEVFSYEGVRSVHKDTFIRVGENEMKSNAYKLNEKGEWEFNEKLIWKRVKPN
ncbi:MAG: hypothetical protein JJ971_13740 [Balneolaceae bacterium]|nr:hypothetical protein [Balneolaceae bacterium]MBO6547081.1 hypothetical protein [Balneolaceae bacterium]MBO6647972.1 hypothetical protein [Balneolaceae bacterium]